MNPGATLADVVDRMDEIIRNNEENIKLLKKVMKGIAELRAVASRVATISDKIRTDHESTTEERI